MFSNFSYLAIKTIIFHEIKDFFIEFQFNIIAPLINTILFVFIISIINTHYSFSANEDSYINFFVPGMIIIVVIQTSFNHLSEVIISMKQSGSFNDYLTSPISRIELFLSFLLSSIIVCTVVGLVNLIVLSFFTDFQYFKYFNLFYYLIVSVIIFSSFGAIIGFLSFTWDVQSSISSFFIVPVTFLSGTFFSIESIDENWHFLLKYNPFYYLVNGFRSSFVEGYDITFINNIFILMVLLFSILFSIFIFKKGYKVIY